MNSTDIDVVVVDMDISDVDVAIAVLDLVSNLAIATGLILSGPDTVSPIAFATLIGIAASVAIVASGTFARSSPFLASPAT